MKAISDQKDTLDREALAILDQQAQFQDIQDQLDILDQEVFQVKLLLWATLDRLDIVDLEDISVREGILAQLALL